MGFNNDLNLAKKEKDRVFSCPGRKAKEGNKKPTLSAQQNKKAKNNDPKCIFF
jgi:hypothetical protein